MLSSEQALALSAATSGHNLLICGHAATGKTHTVKTINKTLCRERSVAVMHHGDGLFAVQRLGCENRPQVWKSIVFYCLTEFANLLGENLNAINSGIVLCRRCFVRQTRCRPPGIIAPE